MKPRFILTPVQHRQRAAWLRRSSDPKALELAKAHEQLARAIEKRLAEDAAGVPPFALSPPISP